MDRTEETLSSIEQKYVQTLCESAHDKIRRVGHRYLDDISNTLIDDLEQETFLQACLNVDTLLVHPKPEGWLIQTAINVARNLRRREMAIKRMEMDPSMPVNDVIEKAGSLDDCLPDTLKPKDKDILIRYYEDQDDIKEIAQDLNMAEGAIKKRLERARARLKEKWRKRKK